MKVSGIDSDGIYQSDVDICEGDIFLVDLEDVGEEKAAKIIARGVEIPLVVESVNEDERTVKPKFFDFSVPDYAVVKKL